MLTYNKTISEPRLRIRYDDMADSPRSGDDNIGFFFTKEKMHKSPDGTDHPLYKIMVEAGDEATTGENHIELIKEKAAAAFKESSPKDGCSHDETLHIIDIYPVYRYEHGNVAYRRGTSSGWDYSSCGFFIVTAQSLSGGTYTSEKIEKEIDDELRIYTQWANGEVYRFTLYDESGVESDSIGGFYDIEHIREHLPVEFKNEKLTEYLS